MSEKPVVITGQIEKITFFNEENGFTIARLSVKGRSGSTTIVGNLVSPIPGQFIRAEGEWTRHPKFGEQFKVLHCESVLPFSAEGIEKYLASGLIRGIGPVMASRIIEEFGAEALDIFEQTPDRLLEIEGIGPAKLRSIKKSWSEQKEIRNLIIFLQDHGVGPGYAARIFRHYGASAINILKSNPYRIASDVAGIGFLTADQIADKLGFEKNSRFRVEAGILYALNQIAESGHVYFPYDGLVRNCRDMLQAEEPLVEAALATAASSGRIVIDEQIPERGVYLAGLHLAESETASRIRSLLEGPGRLDQVNPDKAIGRAQEKLGIRLADKQIDAVRCALDEKVMIITGGPGTGKTTIIKFILEVFGKSGLEICLAAPTGRAAKRMTEATGHPAATIHRLLEFSHSKGGFQRNEENPLKCDLLIVDEVSMIDTVLMQQMLSALPLEIKLILVGDVNQLPSVGPGNVLRDMIGSGIVPVVELDEIFRQAEQSAIIMNAHRIYSGLLPVFRAAEQEGRDFFFIEREDAKEVTETILELVQKRLPAHFGFDPIEDIQLITPMNKGEIGTIALNLALQAALNPPGAAEVSRGGRTFRVLDKVMQVRNNYDREVFNGDVGRIARIDHENQELIVSYDGREISYDFADLDEIVHAYAISVHKSQGSEYPAVIIPVLTRHFIMLQRNLLYTAVTRGKKLVVLIGSKKALAIAVRNGKSQERCTFLKERLKHS